MEKLKSFLNQYFWLIFIGWLALMIVVIVSIYPLFDSFDKTITNQTNESKKAVQEANNANANAANSDIERRTEDVIREKTITPKLDAARKASEKSSQKIKILKKQINENEKVIHNTNVSRADNCAELHRLLPDEKFEYCLD